MQYDPTTIRSWMLKVSSFWRLDKLPVMRGCHFFLQLGQYILHAVLSLPICKKPKFLWFNHASFMVNTSHIDSWMKPNTWGLFWVIFVTKQLQLINSAFMYSIMGANDGASPRAHVNVITIIHSIAYCAITNTLFSSFKLLQQSEVPWNDDTGSGWAKRHGWFLMKWVLWIWSENLWQRKKKNANCGE